jgi:hypothetical protein
MILEIGEWKASETETGYNKVVDKCAEKSRGGIKRDSPEESSTHVKSDSCRRCSPGSQQPPRKSFSFLPTFSPSYSPSYSLKPSSSFARFPNGIPVIHTHW